MKNKVSKIIPYLFILVMLVGFFGIGTPAQAGETLGTCTSGGAATGFWVPQSNCPSPAVWAADSAGGQLGTCMGTFTDPAVQASANSTTVAGCSNIGGNMWKVGSTANPVTPGTPSTPPASTETELDRAITKLTCGITSGEKIVNCVISISYLVFFQLPAFILSTSAQLFNALLSLTISSQLYTQSTFIPEAWAIVRDISNIFFILILLYTAIQVVLGLDHDSKKIIKNVVVMALLINFSMFFTEVVIDSSNVLALIFYNKIAVKGADNAPIPYQPNFNSGVPEKDMGGAIASGFNPAHLMKQEMFDERTVPLPGGGTTTIPAPGPSFYLAIIFMSCAVFLYAAYAFFIAAISFMGRLIELWMLIIFSPFAFMSSSIPALDKIQGLGFHSWIEKLMSTAFMAPIFMFFMYVIAKIVSIDIFSSMQNPSKTVTAEILGVVIPAIISLSLLMKAVEYAKKGGGQFGAAIMTAGKVVGGLALGAATGGAALAATGTLGKLGAMGAGSEGLKEAANKKGIGGFAAKMALKASNYGANATFDARKSPLGALAAKAGLDLSKGTGVLGLSGEKTAGGYKGVVKRKQEKEEAEKEKIKTTMSDGEVQEWSKKKIANYEKSKNESGMSDEEFEKKNGPKPTEYQSANELNASRLKSFQVNIGKTGFVSSVAYSAVKKMNPEASEEEIDKKVKKVKLAVGLTIATLATGGVGAIAGSVAGATGAAIGGAGMAGIATGKYFSTEAAEKGAYKSVGKDVKKLTDADTEIRRLKEEKTDLEDLITKINSEIPEGGNYVAHVKEELEKLETTIQQQKTKEKDIEGSLNAFKAQKAQMVAAGKRVSPALDASIARYQAEMVELQTQNIGSLKKKAEYERAQKAPERVSRINARTETIDKNLAPKDTKHGEDKGIPKPSGVGGGGGGASSSKGHDEHPPAAGAHKN